MPYDIYEDGGQFCVHKKDPDDTQGERIACHDTREEAEAQMRALYAAENKAVKAVGSCIKAVDDNRIGGYLVTFTDNGNLDLHGQYFDKNTEFWLETGYPIKGDRVLIEHGFDDVIKVMPVGIFELASVEDVGLWVRGRLYDREQYETMLKELRGNKKISLSDEQITQRAQLAEQAVKALVKTGKAQWSSGALPQGVQVDMETGHIISWPIIEGTITMMPAEPDGTEVKLFKSAFTELSPLLSRIQTPDVTPNAVTNPVGEASSDNVEPQSAAGNARTNSNDNTEKAIKMDVEQIREILGEHLSAALDAIAEAMDMPADEETMAAVEADVEEQVDQMDEEKQKRLDPEKLGEMLSTTIIKHLEAKQKTKVDAHKGVNKALENWKRNQPAPSNGGAPGYSQATASVDVAEERRFAHLTANEMVAGYLLIESQLPVPMRGKVPANQLVSDAYLKAMTHKVAREVKNGNTFKDVRDEMAIKSVLPFKADEIDATDISGQGQEWVGTWYGTNLWMTARNARVFSALESRGLFVQEIPQGHSSVVVPTEGADPIAYSTPEANDLDAVNNPETTANFGFFGTGNVTLSAGQIKIAAAATDELVEDSVIPVLPNMTRQMQLKAVETLDQALLNGDTATGASTNINLIDNTPGTGTSRPYYLVVNGVRKYPLVTNTAYSRSAAAGLTIDDFRLTLSLFTAPVQVQIDKLLFLLDVFTHNTALALPELQTDDVRRTNATITSGIIQNVYGVDVLVSGFLVKQNSAGKTPAAGGTLGQIICVYPPYWAFGWKRNVRLDVEHDAKSGTTQAVASMRFGFAARGADASAETYNVGIS